MRISILTVGSRGDVQPFMALGTALKDAGHSVLFATHQTFAAEILALGMEFAPLEGDIRQMLQSGAVREVLAAGRNPLTFIPRFIRASEPHVLETVKGMLAASRGSDAVLLAGLGFYGGYDVAEKLSIMPIIAAVQPLQPTREFHNPFFPAPPRWLPFKNAYNRLSHRLFGFLFWQLVRPLLNKARKELLDLPPASRQPVYARINQRQLLSLWGISPSVVPRPADWADWHKMTGYWFIDSPPGWKPLEGLEDYLAAGEPPVYIGFGSMDDEESERLTEITLKALRMVNRRGVLLRGWGALLSPESTDEIYALDAIPHDWLFPRVAAVVHHGGAGTTAAGLRAGVPTVVVPFTGDQFFWADRVIRLGVGTSPGSRKTLTAGKLSQAIQQVLEDEATQQRAARLGESIRGEDGLGVAVMEIEKYAASQGEHQGT